MKARLAIILFVLGFVLGCEQRNNDTLLNTPLQNNDNSNYSKPFIKYTLKQGTIELGNSTLEKMITFENGIVEFQGKDATLDNVKVGDILVGVMSDKIPYGLIEKVIDIKRGNEKTQFTTKTANLDEAFEHYEIVAQIDAATIYKSMSFKKVGVEKYAGDDGIVFKPTPYNFPITFGNKNYPWGPYNIYTNGKQSIKVEGALILNPVLTFKYTMDGSKITQLSLTGSLNLDDSITLTGTALSLNKEVKASYNLTTIPIPYTPLTVGITVYFGVKGSINGNVTVAISAGTTGSSFTTQYPTSPMFYCSLGKPYFIPTVDWYAGISGTVYCGVKAIVSVLNLSFIVNGSADTNLYNNLTFVVLPKPKGTDTIGIDYTLGLYIAGIVNKTSDPYHLYTKTYPFQKK